MSKGILAIVVLGGLGVTAAGFTAQGATQEKVVSEKTENIRDFLGNDATLVTRKIEEDGFTWNETEYSSVGDKKIVAQAWTTEAPAFVSISSSFGGLEGVIQLNDDVAYLLWKKMSVHVEESEALISIPGKPAPKTLKKEGTNISCIRSIGVTNVTDSSGRTVLAPDLDAQGNYKVGYSCTLIMRDVEQGVMSHK